MNVLLMHCSYIILSCNIEDIPDVGLSLVSGYDPHLLDDPELTSGRHRKVLSLASYLVCTFLFGSEMKMTRDSIKLHGLLLLLQLTNLRNYIKI